MGTQVIKVAPTPDEGFGNGDAVDASMADSLGDCWNGVEYETGFYITAFPLHLIDGWRTSPDDQTWGQVHPDGSCVTDEGYCGNSHGCLITSYAEAMERGDAFPSIEIIYRPETDDDRGPGWMSDSCRYAPWLVESGYRRNSAWRLAGFTHAPAIVFADSAEELTAAKAVLLASG